MDSEQDPLRSELTVLGERAAALTGQAFARRLEALAGARFGAVNASSVARAFAELQLCLLQNPRHLAWAQARLWRDGLALAQRMLDQGAGAPPPPRPSDRRFADPAWSDEPAFAHLQQSYLLFTRWVADLVEAQGLDTATRRRARFYARQITSAFAPTNFALTNPEALKRAAETEGRSVVDGLRRFVHDLERGDGRLKITRTPEDAFRVGETVAATPGKVVFRNDLIELLHYAPRGERVRKRPLLVVPPWINKYYVLDLQPNNSFVGFALAQGFDVFLISWVNPGVELTDKRFGDYVREGPLAAVEAIERATGESHVNVLGFCIGGVLTASAIAHLAAKDRQRFHSATFLATLFDFTEVGDMAVFIDAEQVTAIEAHTKDSGFLESHHLAEMFAMLRENDLIWSFFVRSYLLGREPPAFDLLFWNDDATRLPAAMLSDYLRGFYLGNAFARPGTLEILDTPLDARRIDIPVYALATVDDHITPWPSCHAATRVLGGPVRFVLGGSGHIAGVVNPPTRQKYGYWTRDEVMTDPDRWLEGATHVQGSWWSDWASWLHARSGDWVPARTPGGGGLPALGDAPGTYVRVKAED